MRPPRWLLALAVFPMLVVACAKAEPQSHLAAQDLEQPEDAEFDSGKIISIDELTDSTVTGELLRALITYRATEKTNRKNPYGRDSFLATYFSNGLSAIDALLNASEQYRVNPLVLLVRAEMEQGLVGLDFYPIDSPQRVEYVFRCGCSGPDTCDPAFAGFDRQVECLARQYRIILTDMETNGGVTAGGWSKGREGRTGDGQNVTPLDEGTAAAYQFDPRVGTLKEGGNRLFWNIWKLYARSSAYQGPSGQGQSGAWIGDPCTRTEACKAIPGGVCINNYPGGMCSARCTSVGDCPAREGRESACIDTGQGAYCFTKCNSNVSNSCRGGSAEWACCSAPPYPPVPQQDVRIAVCVPVESGRQACAP